MAEVITYNVKHKEFTIFAEYQTNGVISVNVDKGGFPYDQLKMDIRGTRTVLVKEMGEFIKPVLELIIENYIGIINKKYDQEN